MLSINNGFKNSNNEMFENIRNINFDEIKDMYGNLGTFVTQTDGDDDVNIGYDSGVYLYKSKYDSSKALRIYKDFYYYKAISYRDERMISKLQEKQKDVKLTLFPTGVVTIEDYVIGQEIPYFEDNETILSLFTKKNYTKLPTYYYIEILKIIKELYKNDIVYTDIHTRNLLLCGVEKTMQLIDFDPSLVRFGEDKKYLYGSMINALRSTITKLNGLSGINFDESFYKTETLEQIDEYLLEQHEKLLKKV